MWIKNFRITYVLSFTPHSLSRRVNKNRIEKKLCHKKKRLYWFIFFRPDIMLRSDIEERSIFL